MRILHLGLGSFHRAHQAAYLQQLMDSGDTRWSLAGANLRPDMAEVEAALRAQGGHYTLETISPAGRYRYQRIGAIREVLPYEPSLAPVIACGADPRTRIISFTVTEAGYHLDPQGGLDLASPDIQADLAQARAGQPGATLYGAACAILRARRAAGAGPVTLLNCDNLRHNGERFRSALMAFIGQCDAAGLADWVAASTCCPNSMVDRITPRPSPELFRRVQAATGLDDPAAVTAESFSQWVIEDRFAAGRPDWGRVGAELVESVLPYEEAKIRILNASHSCIAWAGSLIGLHYIHEAIGIAEIRQMAWNYVTDDVIPCLDAQDPPSPVNLSVYRDQVLYRFSNPALQDTNQRVAMDGFAKIPGFITPTLRDRLVRDEGIGSAAVLPALFLAFLQRWHEGTLPYAYQDQGMDEAAAHRICAAPDPVAALCASAALWGGIAGDVRLTASVRQACAQVGQFVARHRPQD
ncbi:MAG: Mannitol dehydrogenase domain [Polaromonas sp.]|jgi:D-arabinitol 4-dehydrogenase|nr:Mannitol dehydrogenase domain [Polaromonas sp.]MDB5939447.1 Mannitol dehydrogenase domain [Polaromonas sp.]